MIITNDAVDTGTTVKRHQVPSYVDQVLESLEMQESLMMRLEDHLGPVIRTIESIPGDEEKVETSLVPVAHSIRQMHQIIERVNSGLSSILDRIEV